MNKEYKIKINGVTHFNSFRKNKARSKYSCHKCGKIIKKGDIKYSINTHPGTGHVHLKCASLYKIIYYKEERREGDSYDSWGTGEFITKSKMVLVEENE